MDFSKAFSDITGIGDNAYASTKVENPQEIPTNEVLASTSFAKNEDLRGQYGDNQEAQNKLGPYNRRSMIREMVQDEDIRFNIAGVVAASVLPAYNIAKAINLLPKDSSTSEPSIEDVKQGFMGLGEGFKSYFVKDEPKQESIPDTKYPIVNEAIIKRHKLEQTIDKLLPSLIQTESSGSHTADDGELTTSPKGAKGITQVLPKTAKNPGYGIKPLQDDSEEEYIRFGRDYLTKMVDVFDDVEQGVAAYNAGPGAIHRAISKATRTGKHWTEYIPQETRDYIKKVTG